MSGFMVEAFKAYWPDSSKSKIAELDIFIPNNIPHAPVTI